MVKSFKNAYATATALLYNKDRINDLQFSSGYNVIASSRTGLLDDPAQD